MTEIPKRVPYKGLWISIQHRFGPRRLEWAMGLLTLTLGITKLYTDSFSRPAWEVFRTVFIEERYLGMLMIAIAVVRLGGLIVNGARKHVTPRIRQITAGLTAFLWAGMCYCFWQSGVFSGWEGLYPFFFLFELDNIQQAARDQEHVRQHGRAS
jgi:cytochrome b561